MSDNIKYEAGVKFNTNCGALEVFSDDPIVNRFQDYIDLIKCEDCGAANMTIYMTGVDRKRRCRKCHAEYISPNPPKKEKGKKK